MTAMTEPTTDSESPELAAFRAEARAWLAANAEPRATGSSEYKRRVAAITELRAEEREQIEQVQKVQRQLYDAGFAGLSVPVEYGGRGLTMAHERVWRQESVRYVVDTGKLVIGIGMAVPTILGHGTEEQKLRFIPPALRGEEVLVPALQRAGCGLGPRRPHDHRGARRRRVGRQRSEGVELVRAPRRLGDPDRAHRLGRPEAPRSQLLPRRHDDSGVEARPLRQITGVAHFNETFLTDVRIPADNLLGGLNNGWGVAQTTLMNERAMIGNAGPGIGFADWTELARHYGKLDDPDIRQRLVGLYTRLELLKWLGQRAQVSMRAGKGPGAESSVAKLFGSNHIALNGDLAMAIEGADAMLYATDAYEDGFWQQLFLDQWNSRIGGGTEQIQRNILGERILGLPAEPRPDRARPFREIPRRDDVTASLLPAGAVVATRLTAGAERAQRCIHEEEPVEAGDALGQRALLVAQRRVGDRRLLERRPLLPLRDRPQQEALALVHHRGLPHARELPTLLVVERLERVGDAFEVVARRTHRHVDLLVRVRLAAHAVGAQLLDRAASTASARGCGRRRGGGSRRRHSTTSRAWGPACPRRPSRARNDDARPSKPSSSHMFSTSGHPRVVPRIPHTP